MDKNTLIEELRGMLPQMERLDKHLTNIGSIEQRIANLQYEINQPVQLSIWEVFRFDSGITSQDQRKAVLRTFVGAVAGSLLGTLGSKLAELGGIGRLLGTPFILAGGLLLFASFISCPFYLMKKGKERQREAKEECRQELVRRQADLQTAREAMWEEIGPHWGKITNIIPEDYATPVCIQQVYSYLVNGRADNLKEALNLFEEEQHRARVEENQRYMYEKQQEEIAKLKAMQVELENRVFNAEARADEAYYRSTI